MSDHQSSNPQRGHYDPGWNDPPKLQYNSSINQTGKTKLNLNKRVAFPLQGTSSSVNTSKPTAIVQPSPSLLPLTSLASGNTQSTVSSLIPSTSQPPVAIVTPMPQANQPPLMHRVPPLDNTNNSSSNSISNAQRNQEQQQNDDLELNENTREYCLNIFQRFIFKIQESTNVRSDEIQRRLNLMNQMWLSGTLNSSVHMKLLKISKALEANNFNDAIENHRALVVDHSNVCAAWGAALRQIILTIQQQDNRNVLLDAQQIISTNNTNILIPIINNTNTETSISATSDRMSETMIHQSQSESSNNIQHI